MTKENAESDLKVEEMRRTLREKHLQDFFDTLKNSDNPSEERASLIGVLSIGLSRLCDVEEAFVVATTGDEDVCLGCLAANVVDHANIVAVANSFNHYLSAESQHND